MAVGKLVLRFKYPDGRLTAMICVDHEWQVEVFASLEDALQFAEKHDLTVEERKDDGDQG